MRTRLQQFALGIALFSSFSASGRFCERVAVPQPRDPVALSIFKVSESEAFLGHFKRNWIGWKRHVPNDKQIEAAQTLKKLFHALERRDYYAIAPTKEELRQDLSSLAAQMQRDADSHNWNLDHFPDNFVVAQSWRQYAWSRRRYEAMVAHWQSAPLHSERKQIVQDYESDLRHLSQSLSEQRLELLRDSPLWGHEIVNATLIHSPSEPAYLEIEDSQGRYFTWQPQELQARLAVILQD